MKSYRQAEARRAAYEGYPYMYGSIGSKQDLHRHIIKHLTHAAKAPTTMPIATLVTLRKYSYTVFGGTVVRRVLMRYYQYQTA